MFEPPPHHDHRAAGQILDCLAVEMEMKRFIWDILIVQQEVEMITGLIIHLADSLLFFSSFFLCIMCECEKSNIKALFTCVCVFMCVYKCSIPAFYSPPFLHLPLHNAEGLLCACRRLCDTAVWRRPNHRHWLCFYLSTTKAFIVVLCSLFCWCGHRQRETWLYLHIVDAFTLCEDHCFFSEQHFKADLQSNMYICSYCGAWWPVFMSKCRV